MFGKLKKFQVKRKIEKFICRILNYFNNFEIYERFTYLVTIGYIIYNFLFVSRIGLGISLSAFLLMYSMKPLLPKGNSLFERMVVEYMPFLMLSIYIIYVVIIFKTDYILLVYLLILIWGTFLKGKLAFALAVIFYALGIIVDKNLYSYIATIIGILIALISSIFSYEDVIAHYKEKEKINEQDTRKKIIGFKLKSYLVVTVVYLTIVLHSKPCFKDFFKLTEDTAALAFERSMILIVAFFIYALAKMFLSEKIKELYVKLLIVEK